ncbi:MAG: FHA domain-containing protein [Bacteroides sp.]|nr:FHA domain-containing protein [Bacteroides sp.]
MEITLGRESGNNRLHITEANNNYYIGKIGSVPQSVSRQHCKLVIDESGNHILSNIKADNITYVNGLQISSKHISLTDHIELGNEHYPLNLQEVLAAIRSQARQTNGNKEYSINHLEKIWEDYNDAKLQIQIQERRSNAISSITGLFSMASIACGFIPDISLDIRILLYAAALLLAIYFFITRYRSSEAIPKYLAELDKKFHEQYTCPNPECQRFLGYQPYNDLRKTTGCPQCKAQYKSN